MSKELKNVEKKIAHLESQMKSKTAITRSLQAIAQDLAELYKKRKELQARLVQR